MKNLFKLMALILSLFIFAGCSSAKKTEVEINDRVASGSFEEITLSDKTVLAQSDNVSLEYEPENTRFLIKDLSGNTLWKSGLTEEDYGKEIKNKLLKNGLRQIINVLYTDFETKSGAINTGAGEPNVKYGKLDNGLKISFYFPKEKIGLTIEVSLVKDKLVVRIPKDSIKEEGKYFITSMDVFPMFGASPSGDNEDDYIFYPDGSGSLYEFNKKPIENAVPMTNDLYGALVLDMDKYLNNKSLGIKPITMPVYGLKNGKNSFLSIITSGDVYSGITLAPDGYIYALNRVFPTVRYRKGFVYVANEGKEVVVTEKDTTVGDFEMQIGFLNGDDAHYSGMAQLYQKHLIETGILNNKINEESYPFAIDFLMNAREDSIISESVISMTTPKQAMDILAVLKENGLENGETILWGWQKKGIGQEPSFGAPKNKGDLNKLGQYGLENGVKMFLQQDYLRANDGQSGFSKYNDIIYSMMKAPIADLTGEMFFLNGQKAKSQWALTDKKIADNANMGIAVGGITAHLTENYHESQKNSRRETADLFSSLVADIKENAGLAAVESGNAYALKNVDRIYNLPNKASGYPMLDRNVPFAQIVFHGYLSYTSEIPMNLASSSEELLLNWIEYGELPYYVLTHEATDKLNRSDYNFVLSSAFSFWKDKIIENVKLYHENFKGLQNERILTHFKLKDNLYETSYSGGTKVYVNYGYEEESFSGEKIPARGFKIIKSEVE